MSYIGNKKNGWMAMVLFVFLGLAGGLAGGLFGGAYIFYGKYSVPFFGNEIDFSDGNYRGSNLIIREAKKVVVEQNDKTSEAINSARANMVGIFKRKAPVNSSEFKEGNYYVLGEEIAQGFIITSDGLIMTSFNPDDIENYVIVASDKKVYDIDRFASDALTGVNFLRAKAKDLPVKRFAALNEIKAGQLVLAVNWDGRARVTFISNSAARPTVLIDSSDSFPALFEIADEIGEEYKGALLFSLSGDAVGIVSGGREARPISHFNAAISSLLKNGEIRRPKLGVNYIDLSRLVSASAKTAAAGQSSILPDKGALIFKDEKGVAIVRGSAAQLASLKSGDIILSVNNIEINGGNSLADIIQGMQAGDRVIISYMRGAEKKEAEVELGGGK